MSAPDFFRLAGETVRVEWRDDPLRAALGGALEHRATPETMAAWQIEARAGRNDWPTAPGGGLSLQEDASGMSMVDTARRIAVRVDAVAGQGVFECDDAGNLPVSERGAPFHGIFQRWLASRRTQMLHAGAVGLPGRGAVLLAARSGGGKSNTVLACLGSTLALLGEDFVAVDDATPPRVWSLYSTAKLHAADVGKFPALAADVAGLTAGGEKTLLSLGRRHAARFADGLPLRGILVLKITGQRDTRLVPAAAAEAVKEMLASLLMVVPSARRGLFEFAVRLAGRVPVRRLELGTDLRQPPEVIREFLERAPS